MGFFVYLNAVVHDLVYQADQHASPIIFLKEMLFYFGLKLFLHHKSTSYTPPVSQKPNKAALP
jgi:hypothetical protein